jgi:hypothetical protein
MVADLELTCIQEHPKLVEDVDLSSTSLIASKRFGTIQGNICHIKLAMILEQVLSQMYSVKPKNLETRIEAAEKLEKDLDDWYESSSNLEPSIGDPTSKLGLLLVIVHVHAQILLYRPFLLDHLIPPAADDGHREFLHQRATRKVEACLQSATVMTALISAMSKKDTYFSTFWVTTPPSPHLPNTFSNMNLEVRAFLRLLRNRSPLRLRHKALLTARLNMGEIFRRCEKMPGAYQGNDGERVFCMEM